MSKAEMLIRLESKLRPLAVRFLPPKMAVYLYSAKRIEFLEMLKADLPGKPYNPPEHLRRRLWGIDFRSPVMNSAGMFKNGECAALVEMQGAGAYLGGTGTWNARKGNKKSGIYLPFAVYPRSHSASNWLGLPNDGDMINAGRARLIKSEAVCPVGWSVMGSPDLDSSEKIAYLIRGMEKYQRAGVDFLEINESCPNTSHSTPQEDDLANRLRFISKRFCSGPHVPVIAKFSNDTQAEQVPALMDLLFELGFGGVNFGNTSTDYEAMSARIHPHERKLFDFYTGEFGGGVSGAPVKERSLELCSRAVEYLKAGPPSQEFHVIRTGGIETWQDIQESERAGISLNQWFSGYFEAFARHGHNLYRELFKTAVK